MCPWEKKILLRLKVFVYCCCCCCCFVTGELVESLFVLFVTLPSIKTGEGAASFSQENLAKKKRFCQEKPLDQPQYQALVLMVLEPNGPYGLAYRTYCGMCIWAESTASKPTSMRILYI